MTKRVLNDSVEKKPAKKEEPMKPAKWFRIAEFSGANGRYVVCCDSDLQREEYLQAQGAFIQWLYRQTY